MWSKTPEPPGPSRPSSRKPSDARRRQAAVLILS
jgi:hypothetical protein